MIITSKLVNKFLFLSNYTKFCTAIDSVPTPPPRGSAMYFYKRSLQRLTNVKGTFTQHHLIRLTKLSRKIDDIDLLFEGFYNYLGRNAQITTRTLDKMFIKIIQILKANPQVVKDSYFQKICYVLHKHEYFAYFPQYEITSNLLEIFGQPQHYKKLLQIMRFKPLIKMNEKCFEIVLSKLATFPLSQVTLILRLVSYRLSYMSLHDINYEVHNRLLVMCTKLLAQRKDIQILPHSPNLTHWIDRNYLAYKQKPTEQLAYAIAMGTIINQKVGNLLKVMKLLPKITEQGQKLFKFINVLKNNKSNIELLKAHNEDIEKFLKQKQAPQNVKKLAKKVLST